MLSINNRPEIVEAYVIYSNGNKVKLKQGKIRNEGLSQCLFFTPDIDAPNGMHLQFRLDFNDVDEYNNPRLDADLYKDEKKVKIGDVHHTTKKLQDEWIYEWPGINKLNLCSVSFKLETTNQQNITGMARIIK